MNAQLPAELPAGLADPLHYPGAGSPWLERLLLVLLLAALAALVHRWRARRKARSGPPPSRPIPRTPVVRAIDTLRDRFVAEARFRAGCHELAALLKAHFEAADLAGSASLPYTRMTAREIARAAGDQPATRLFEVLSDLQFGRPEPSQDDFVGACELAGQVVRR